MLIVDFAPGFQDLMKFMAGDVATTTDDVGGNEWTGERFRDRFTTPPTHFRFDTDVDVTCEFTTTSFAATDTLLLDIPTIEAVCP